MVNFLRPYLVMWGACIRAQRSYATNFTAEFLGMIVVMAVEVAEVMVYSHNAPVLGGLTLTGLLIIIGLSGMSFALGDLIFGHIDNLWRFVHRGRLETMYTRPLSVLGQLICSEFILRRLGRMVISGGVLAYALWRSGRNLGLPEIALVIVAVASGVLIFGALFVLAGSLQFFVINAPEIVNVMTYATNYASQLPTAIFPRPMQWLYLTLLPAAFISYLPTVALLGEESLVWVPAGGAWLAPIMACVAWSIALTAWHAGSKRYEGAGG